MKRSLFLLLCVLCFAALAQAQNTYSGGVSGTVTGNCIPKSSGNRSITSSYICDDGTTVTINTNKVSITAASGNTAVAGTLDVIGLLTLSGGIANTGTLTNTGALAVVSASATSLAVGRLGATTPAFVVDSSAGTQVAGLSITGAATGGTVAVATIDSGSATNLTINAKGTGTIGIGSVSTGAVTITPATNITGALVVTGTMNGPFGATRVTGSTQLITAAMSGRLFAVNNASDAVTVLTLPAAATAGLRYCFSADAVTGSNREVDVETPAGSDLIVGTTTAAGGTGIASTAGASHGIKNTHASAVRGNAVCVQSDGVNTWYMTSLSGTWAAY